MRFNFCLPAFLAAWCLGTAQSEKKLTARELFYTPLAATKATAPKPAATPEKPKPAKPTPAKPSQSPVPGEILTPVSSAPESARPPLALRYSLLKQSSDGEYVEVDPDTTFRSGDRLKVSVESNDAAHLYVVQQGSSKAWNVLFPNEDTGHGDNRVERGKRVTIPAGGRFTFDEQPGTERLFLVLSRQAEPDLEKMIYDLSRGSTTAPATAPENRPKMMLAVNRLDDALVNRLRGQMTSRDLVFEKVSEDKPAPGGKREKAIYYGTQDRTPRARIIIDLNLRHQ